LTDNYIVLRHANLPSVHTAIHLTYESLLRYKTCNKVSKQGRASGNPIPPIAATITSCT